ncbi:hypothetical protein KIN20_019966 [Parelaphostrongylus tenuis]|uniref:Uncharacterized protein n=1 Tax=Parelaphostrongylus tenuis TaxID=148309 RepID=A0AAD5MLX3_PARTN|nr:hypothetical protein KIN20_019966 [Parelaphostrongylus tenuis]
MSPGSFYCENNTRHVYWLHRGKDSPAQQSPSLIVTRACLVFLRLARYAVMKTASQQADNLYCRLQATTPTVGRSTAGEGSETTLSASSRTTLDLA